VALRQAGDAEGASAGIDLICTMADGAVLLARGAGILCWRTACKGTRLPARQAIGRYQGNDNADDRELEASGSPRLSSPFIPTPRVVRRGGPIRQGLRWRLCQADDMIEMVF